MSEEKEKLKMYHDTLLRERALKERLVKKLESIQKLVDSYSVRAGRNTIKHAGIPFGFASLSSAFVAAHNASDNESKADAVICQIKEILRK